MRVRAAPTNILGRTVDANPPDVRAFVPATVQARLLVALLYGALFAGMLAVVFMAQDTYEDHRYNMGVIKLTAMGANPFHLLTSLTGSFFKYIGIVRPEDWHRGLSLVLASAAYRILPSDLTLRGVHAVYAAAFGGVLYIIARRCIADIARSTGQAPSWLPFATMATFAATPLAMMAMARFTLDDLPASLFAVAAVGVLLWRRTPSVGAILACGVLLGLAVWMKDLFVLWIPMLALVLCIVLRAGGESRGIGMAIRVVLLVSVAGLVVLTKFGWNLVEIGAWLPQGSMNHNRVYMFGYCSRFDAEFPFYLTGDTHFRSIHGIAGNYESAACSVLARDIEQIPWTLKGNAFLCLVALGCLLVPRRAWPDLSSFHGRILLTGLVVFTMLEAFLALGGGELRQARYAIGPLALLYAAIFPIVVVHVLPYALRSRWRALLCMAPLLLLLDKHVIALFVKDPQLAATSALASAAATTPRTIMLDPKQAIYVYSLSPRHLLAIHMPMLLDLPALDLRRLLTDFDVGYALLGPHEAAIGKRLRTVGFRPIAQAGQNVVMGAPPTGGD